ncbi:hypothetical protein [Streptomyces sp. NPDC006309]|uniref:hypothetical protein n=1 Tax=Streptomyces sp. NPDC006309 TaxID=3156749 RepID=UPI0033B80D6F
MLRYRLERLGLSMREQDVVSVSVAVLAPIVTAVAGVVSIVLQDRHQRRSRAGRRRLAFEDANRQVAFAVEWWKARQLLPSTPETLQGATALAHGWLDEASERVNTAERASTDEEPHVSVSRLLLLYRFPRRSAKAIRIGFFVALWALLSQSKAYIDDALSDKPAFAMDGAFLVGFGLLTLVLRFWAASADSATEASARTGEEQRTGPGGLT